MKKANIGNAYLWIGGYNSHYIRLKVSISKRLALCFQYNGKIYLNRVVFCEYGDKWIDPNV